MPLNLADLDPTRFRPMVMWKWNTDPTKPLLRRQLQQIVEAGFGGVCIEPKPANFRPGDFPDRMSVAYLGPEYLDAYRYAVDVAASLGLRVWLYDEGGWPSGQACGLVLAGHDHLRGQQLVREAGRFVVERTGRPDLLKRESTDRFLALTHEAYKPVVGEYFGNTIEAVFSDELTVPGMVGTDRIPWTDDLPAEFHRRAGYSIDEVLPLLFEGAGRHPRQLQARRDFTAVWNQLFIERCIQPQRDWCTRHGLKFIGHLAGEHDLARHPVCFGDYFAAMRCFSMAGIDTIWRQIWPDHVADFALLAGSVRTVTGVDEALSETGAVYGLDFTPAQCRWVCTQQVMRGVNRFTLMSLPLAETLDVGLAALEPAAPTWAAMPELNETIARTAVLTSVGRAVVNTAVLYPSDDLAAGGSDAPGAAAQQLLSQLHRQGGGAIYVDGRALVEGQLGDGVIRCGQADIRTLYVMAGTYLADDLRQRLREIEHAGVRVREVAGFTEADANALVSGPGRKQVSLLHRRGEDWDLLLIFNESAEPAELQVSLPRDAQVLSVDRELTLLGSISPGDSLTVPAATVRAVAWGNVAPVRSSGGGGEGRRELAGPWTITPSWSLKAVDHRWMRVPSDAEPKPVTLGDWRPVVGECFSGVAAYQTSFVLDRADTPLRLDLGAVRHVAEVWLNGVSLGRRAWGPYRFDCGSAARAGRNELRIDVGNTAADAYWSPANLAAEKQAGRWNIYGERILERCQPTLGGGLIGPVVLETRKNAS